MKTPRFRAYDYATKRIVHSTDDNISFIFDKEGWIVCEKIQGEKVKVTEKEEGLLMEYLTTLIGVDIYEEDIIEVQGRLLVNNKKKLWFLIYQTKHI